MANSQPVWDVNKYKSEFESEEHWNLRKNFMLAHMDKFSEDKLVCLAQVFFNVEFLGCRYPEETMRMVAELSKGVADEHREKQKGRLKRTFVKASNAAEAKVKGQNTQYMLKPVNKEVKIREDSDDVNSQKRAECGKSAINNTTASTMAGDFPGLIIFKQCDRSGTLITSPLLILQNSLAKSEHWTYGFHIKERNCTFKINNKVLASAKGKTNKEAKVNSAIKGLEILQKSCYTIQAKQRFSSDLSIIKGAEVTQSYNALSVDNIGCKIMQKMGWSGSGLGKDDQGIQNPIQASAQIMNRQGLGHNDPKELQKKYRQFFHDYVKSDNENDIVFSVDFTNEERSVLHKLAQSFKLKTRSYGQDQERQLVVSKPVSLTQLLKTLLACGGENAKYQLIPPTRESGDDDRYPEVTTKKVIQLPKTVADERGEKQRDQFQRTDVKGSDSAEAKENGLETQSLLEPVKKEEENNINGNQEKAKCCKTELNASQTGIDTLSLLEPMKKEAKIEKETVTDNREKPKLSITDLRKALTMSGNFPGLIIFEPYQKGMTTVVNTLRTTLEKSELVKSEFIVRDRKCSLKINNTFVAYAEGRSNLKAEYSCATKALKILQKFFYTIQEKQPFFSTHPPITKQVEQSDNAISSIGDNAGWRIMQKMGWTGSGLGRTEQGIRQPIKVLTQSNRQGFGQNDVNELDFKRRFENLIHDYFAKDTEEDLCFSSDFTDEEKSIITRLAYSFHLKVRHHGKRREKQLVVSKPLSLDQVLKTLLACGGENSKYRLIPPTGEIDDDDDDDRYPEKDMNMVAETSKGVDDEDIKKQRYKCRRTIVNASDAAKVEASSMDQACELEEPKKQLTRCGRRRRKMKEARKRGEIKLSKKERRKASKANHSPMTKPISKSGSSRSRGAAEDIS